MAEGSGTGKGCKKKGRAGRKPTHKAYVANRICQKNKIKRVFESSGAKAASEFARVNAMILPQYVKDALSGQQSKIKE